MLPVTATFPPLPDELVELIQGGVSLLTGTCSAVLVPESVRAGGLRVWPGACKLTVLRRGAPTEHSGTCNVDAFDDERQHTPTARLTRSVLDAIEAVGASPDDA